MRPRAARRPHSSAFKRAAEEALLRRSDAQDEVNYFADKYRRSRDPEREARYLEYWHGEQRMFDLLNDLVGLRYKARLENRSWAKGASREVDC